MILCFLIRICFAVLLFVSSSQVALPPQIILGHMHIENENSDQINEAIQELRDNEIVPNYVQFAIKESLIQCSPYSGYVQFFNLIQQDQICVLLGCPCHQTKDVIGRVAVSLNTLVIAQSPNPVEMTKKSMYKTLITTNSHAFMDRTHASLVILEEFNWTSVAIVWLEQGLAQVADDLGYHLTAHNINVTTQIWMHMYEMESQKQLELLNAKARIIILLVDDIESEELYLFVQEAKKANMTGANYVWFFVNLDVPAVYSKIMSQLTSAIFLESNRNMNGKELNYKNYTDDFDLFDSMYTYGMALNLSVENDIDYRNGSGLFQLLKWKIINGPHGDIIFDEHVDRAFTYILISQNLQETSPMLFIDRQPNLDTGRYDYIVTPLRSQIWATTDGNPPKDIPECGFDNSLCITDNTIVYIIVSLVLIGAITIIIYIVKQKFGGGISREMNWRLDPEKLDDFSSGMITKSITSIQSNSLSARISSIGSRPNSALSSSSAHMSNNIGRYNFMKYESNTVYAFNLSKLKEINFSDDQQKTLNKMKGLAHENVATFFGLANSPKQFLFVVWSSPAKRTLRDTMQKNDLHLDDDFIASFLKDVVNGLKYIHQSQIGVHGSLTSETCLVDSRLVVRLSDYGMGKVLAPMVVGGSINVPVDNYELFHMAPEALFERKSIGISTGSQQSDIYSMAMVFYEIITKQELFNAHMMDIQELLAKIHASKSASNVKPLRPAFPDDMSPSWVGLIKFIDMCWDQNPSLRPSIDNAYHIITKATRGFSGNIIEKMIRRMEIYTNNLEKVVAERTLEVQEQQERAERLLQQLLPKSVADKLQAGLPVEPEWFESATILFTDIVGFTTMASRHTALEVVTLLNMLYSAFDGVIGKHDAYKVETIGDAYMVVSGVPHRTPHHAHEIASIAIGMRDTIAVFKPPFGDKSEDTSMRIRLGAATGSVATGVIGIQMPKFCLFGDTVNFASRMESNGLPMKIQVNAVTASELEKDPMFALSYRAEMEIKGKGKQKTYFVEKSEHKEAEEDSATSSSGLF